MENRFTSLGRAQALLQNVQLLMLTKCAWDSQMSSLGRLVCELGK